MDSFERLATNASHSLSSFASQLDPEQWAIVALVAVVFGYMMLRGNMIKGA